MLLLTLKKLLARLLFPVPLLGMLLFAGVLLLLYPGLGKRARSAGKWLTVTAMALFFIASTTGIYLLAPLTVKYAPLDPAVLPEGELYHVVVAGSGFQPEPEVPPELWFNDAMILRLHEAGRIAQLLGQRGIAYRITASVCGEEPEKKLPAPQSFFRMYGVGPERVGLVDERFNSRQEVMAFCTLPGKKILVSEGFHIPRLMMLSRRYGLDALPAPATRIVPKWNGVLTLVPSAANLKDCERAVYEYLGMLEYWLF